MAGTNGRFQNPLRSLERFCPDNNAAAARIGECSHIFCELSFCVVATGEQIRLGLRIEVLSLELAH